MTDGPETTPIQNKYAQQFADDLEANRKKQADVAQQLEQLRLDEAWLIQALGNLPAAVAPSGPEAETVEAKPAADTDTAAPAETVADALQTVPKPRRDKPVKSAQPKLPAKKTAAAKTTAKATAKKPAAKKTTTKKTVAEKAPAETAPTAEVPAQKPAPREKAGPPLHELVLAVLLKTPGEPRVAREVTDQFAQDHPSRKTTVQLVRNALETLVKKNAVEKSHQQGSAMYTAYAAAEADAAPAADDTADSETEEAPETAGEKVPAEV